MNVFLSRAVAIGCLFLIPSFANACGLGMIPISDEFVFGLIAVTLLIFLAGYLPYAILNFKLYKQAATPEGIQKNTKIGASIFTLINTIVFVACMLVVIEQNPLIIIADCLLWGIPMFFYIKGMITRPPAQSGMHNV